MEASKTRAHTLHAAVSRDSDSAWLQGKIHMNNDA